LSSITPRILFKISSLREVCSVFWVIADAIWLVSRAVAVAVEFDDVVMLEDMAKLLPITAVSGPARPSRAVMLTDLANELALAIRF
jgi:hypothetical protein